MKLKDMNMRWVLLFMLMIAAVVTRWLPHPHNVSPIMALALFSAQGTGWALPKPVAIGPGKIADMVEADFFGNLFDGHVTCDQQFLRKRHAFTADKFAAGFTGFDLEQAV